MQDITLLVIAKEPIAGRVKTRLSPPFSREQAAALAEAALLDTLHAVALTPAARRILVFEGDPGGRVPSGFEVAAQQGVGLDERLAAAFAQVDGAALLVGMDTPQVTSALLSRGVAALLAPGVDAVIGPACDGGYWSVGLARPTPEAFLGIPMSLSSTLAHQHARLRRLGLSVNVQPRLRDVDTVADAVAVAHEASATRFASALRSMIGEVEQRPPVAVLA